MYCFNLLPSPHFFCPTPQHHQTAHSLSCSQITTLSLLKAKWIIFGLEAPVISWLVAISVVLGTFYAIGRLWYVTNREAKSYRQLIKDLPKNNSRHGVPQEDSDHLNRQFEKSSLKPCWQDFAASLVQRRGSDDRDYFLATASAKESFSEEATIGNQLNLESYNSLPGIITGVGLLFTFIAILIALLDVRLNNNRVQGIELLIQGLSGKFVSSIAALLMATLYIWWQKIFFHRLAKARSGLVSAVDRLFPRLTTAHLLEESRQQIAEQTNAIRLFNSNLAPTLKNSITENLGPTMGRMVESVENLNTYLRQIEANKQDSITGSIEKLLNDLGSSLSQSIDRMSQSFSDSLSGNARQEMAMVVTSLSGTASLLDEMNKQFKQTQQSLSQLIEIAQLSTAEQFREGRSQVESMTAKFDDLVTQMSLRLATNAETTNSAAQQVIAQAGQWSEQNAARFEQMLADQTQQTANVEALRAAFENTLGSFTQAIGQHSAVINNLQQVTAQVASTVRTIKSAAQEMQETQTALQQVAGQSEKQVENLAEANAHQAEAWKTIQMNLDNYRDTFTQVESAADELLNQLNTHIKNYTEATNNGFRQMVEMADNHFSNATSKLGASVGELDDVLSDLADTLGRTHPTKGQNGN
jgi:ABC-type transporter Mla subunit MlaD